MSLRIGAFHVEILIVIIIIIIIVIIINITSVLIGWLFGTNVTLIIKIDWNSIIECFFWGEYLVVNYSSLLYTCRSQ